MRRDLVTMVAHVTTSVVQATPACVLAAIQATTAIQVEHIPNKGISVLSMVLRNRRPSTSYAIS